MWKIQIFQNALLIVKSLVLRCLAVYIVFSLVQAGPEQNWVVLADLANCADGIEIVCHHHSTPLLQSWFLTHIFKHTTRVSGFASQLCPTAIRVCTVQYSRGQAAWLVTIKWKQRYLQMNKMGLVPGFSSNSFFVLLFHSCNIMPQPFWFCF